jgi:hypothetical protein
MLWRIECTAVACINGACRLALTRAARGDVVEKKRQRFLRVAYQAQIARRKKTAERRLRDARRFNY